MDNSKTTVNNRARCFRHFAECSLHLLAARYRACAVVTPDKLRPKVTSARDYTATDRIGLEVSTWTSKLPASRVG